ncbi:MAG: ExbD/TolR family protein [Steroidobacteraceae bacterium]
MSMNVGSSGSDEPMMDVNTTPLIDVMLVLLVMFIITIPPTKHSTEMDMPQNNPNQIQSEPPEVIDLVIDFDGTYYWNGEQMSLDRIEQLFAIEHLKNPQPELHVRPDKWSKYDAVARILAAAQRGRMDKLGVVGMEQYM